MVHFKLRVLVIRLKCLLKEKRLDLSIKNYININTGTIFCYQCSRFLVSSWFRFFQKKKKKNSELKVRNFRSILMSGFSINTALRGILRYDENTIFATF